MTRYQYHLYRIEKREPRITSSEVKSCAKDVKKIGKADRDGIEFGASCGVITIACRGYFL